MVDGLQQSVVSMMKGVFVVEKLVGLQAFELILHCFTMPRVGYALRSWD